MRGLQFITGDFNGEPTGRCNCTILATDDTQEMTISLVGDEEESFCLDITTENIERCLHSPKEIKKLLPNIVTTPRVQLIGSALQIAHEIKLNKADIYPDAIIGRAENCCGNTTCNGGGCEKCRDLWDEATKMIHEGTCPRIEDVPHHKSDVKAWLKASMKGYDSPEWQEYLDSRVSQPPNEMPVYDDPPDDGLTARERLERKKQEDV